MINREIIRIKIVQLTYAYYQNGNKNIDSAEKELFFSLSKAYDLYNYLLSLIVSITKEARKHLEVAQAKARREGEKEPSQKFAYNRFAIQLEENKMLNDFMETQKKSWDNDIEFVRKLYKQIADSQTYADYMADTEDSYAADRELWRKIYRTLIQENEELDAILEEQSLYWNDDKEIVDTFVLKTIKRFDEKNVNKNKDGTWRVYTYWPGGKAYHSCFLTVLNRYLNEDIARLKDIGINGTYHVDVTSIRIPSPCCNPLHPLTRQAMVDVENKIGRKLRENFGGFSSEGKFDHVAPTLDYGLYVRWDSLAKNTIIDKDVPLNELVLNGIILSNPYYGTIDAPYERKAGENLSDVNKPYCVMGTARRARLKVIEYGGRPSFYYIDYSDLAPMKWIYDDWQKLKYLQFRFFVFHDEIAPDVFLTVFGDGSKIVTNYSDKPFSYENQTVASLDYKLFKP